MRILIISLILMLPLVAYAGDIPLKIGGKSNYLEVHKTN